jgi:hypothetical protein
MTVLEHVCIVIYFLYSNFNIAKIIFSYNNITSVQTSYFLQTIWQCDRDIQYNHMISETEGLRIANDPGGEGVTYNIVGNTIIAPIPAPSIRMQGRNFVTDNVFRSTTTGQNAFYLYYYCPPYVGASVITNNRIIGGSFILDRSGYCPEANSLTGNIVEDAYMENTPVFSFSNSHYDMAASNNIIRNSRTNHGPAIQIQTMSGKLVMTGNTINNVTSGDSELIRVISSASQLPPLTYVLHFANSDIYASSGKYLLSVAGYSYGIYDNKWTANSYEYIVVSDQGHGFVNITKNYWDDIVYTSLREKVVDVLTDPGLKPVSISPFYISTTIDDSQLRYYSDAYWEYDYDEVWEDPHLLVENSIIIGNGARFTIANQTTFTDYANIIVESGGILIVNGTELTGTGYINAGGIIFRPGTSSIEPSQIFNSVITSTRNAIVCSGDLVIDSSTINTVATGRNAIVADTTLGQSKPLIITNSEFTVSDNIALIHITGSGARIIYNNFNIINSKPILSYTATDNIPLDLSYNKWHTQDTSIIETYIVTNDSNNLQLSPVYDDASSKYFDLVNHCYLVGQTCDPAYTCAGVNQSDSSVCSGYGSCIAPDVCMCNSFANGTTCQNHQQPTLQVIYSTEVLPCSNAEVSVTLAAPFQLVTVGIASYSLVNVASGDEGLADYLLTQQSAQLSIPSSYLKFGHSYSISIMATAEGVISIPTTITFNVTGPFLVNITVPQPYYRSYTVTVTQSALFPSCIYTNATYDWLLYKGTNTIQTATGTSMTINKYSPLMTTYGVYTIRLSTTIDKMVQVTTQTFTLSAMKPSIQIIGGSQVLKFGSNYTVQTVSSDPDYTVITGAKYSWSCTLNGTQMCTEVTDIITTSNLLFKPTSIGVYVLTVQFMTFNGRKASANVTMDVVVPTTRVPSVLIVTSVPSRITQQHKLIVQAKVEPSANIASVALKWSLTAQGQTENILNQNTILSGTTTAKTLSFIPSALSTTGIVYTLMIEANYVGETIKAYSTVSFSLYSQITTGTFSINPMIGYQIDTTFSFSATGWNTDLDALPLRYSFEYLNKNGQYVPIKLMDGTTTMNTQLIRGSDDSSSDQTLVRCRVQNAYGVEASVTKTITILSQSIAQNTTSELLTSILDQLSSSNSTSTTSSYQLLLAANLYNQQQTKNTAVLGTMLDIIQNLNATTDSETSDLIVQKSIALDIITKNISIVTDSQTRLKTLNVVNSILTTGKTSTTTSSSASIVYTTVGNVISNIITSTVSTGSSQQEFVQQTGIAITSLSQYVLHSVESGDNATVVTTDSFTLSVVKDYGSELQDKTISDESGNSVFIPQTDSLSQDIVLSAEYINFENTAESVLWNERTENITSSITSFRLLDQTGNKISFAASNDNPLVITLTRSLADDFNSSDSKEIVCKYLNDFSESDEWDTAGCYLAQATVDSIVCHCNHTTSFAAFVQYTNDDLVTPSKIQKAVYYVSVIVYGLFFIISAVLLLFLLLQRNYQPVRSRLFAPYICLFAIMVECALLVVRSGLWLSTDAKPNIDAINIVGYVIMFVSNPLSIVSLFIFLWQMARYFVMRHSYYLMGLETSGSLSNSNRKLKILKLFTSRAVFLTLSILVYGVTLVYFLAYSVTQLSIRKKLTANVINANVVALAVSYAGIVLILGIIIVLLFMWDVVVIPHQTRVYQKKLQQKRVQMEQEMSTPEVGKESNKKKQKPHLIITDSLHEHFVKEDPLYFRLNSVIMVLSILTMFVSYGIGIANRYLEKSDQSVVMIISLAFDLAYTLLRIIAYGGFIAVLRVIFLIRTHGNPYAEFSGKTETTDFDNADNIMNIIENVLNHQVGFELAKEYCITEFSVENLLVWNMLRSMNFDWLVISKTQRIELWSTLVTKYIKSGSPCEINIPSRVRKEIIAIYSKIEEVTVEEQLKTLHTLAVAIITNLSDTFSRFSETEAYQRFVEVHLMNRVLEESMTDKKTKASIKWFSYDLIEE